MLEDLGFRVSVSQGLAVVVFVCWFYSGCVFSAVWRIFL